MTRAALYARVSSEMQADNWSIEAQLEACHRLARDRGWEIAAEYKDVESAKTTARPEFQRMLQAAERHDFDVVVVHKLDRFSRSVVDTLSLLSDLDAIGVSLTSASEPFDFTTPMGRMMMTMLASFAEYFLANLSTEVAKGKRKRAENGHWNAAVPFGYSVEWMKDGGDGMPRIDEEAARGVRMAFERYATGHYSDSDIAKMLNEAGYRPHGRGNRGLELWSKDTICDLLQNRFYLGAVRYHRDWHPGQHEPIIDLALFERVQSVRRIRRCRKDGCTPWRARTYLLSGIAYCERCKTKLRGQASHDIGYYRDTARDHGRECDQDYIRQDAAEAAVGNILRTIVLPDDWRNQVLEQLGARAPDVAQIEAQRRRIETQLGRLRDLYQMEDIGREEYQRRRDELQAQAAALKSPDTLDIEAAAALLANFGALWDEATEQERQRIVRSLLAKVYLDSESGPVVAIEPTPTADPLFTLDTGATGIRPSCSVRHPTRRRLGYGES
jgi:site-specific DNA recombinase